jgi:hypothetical protein
MSESEFALDAALFLQAACLSALTILQVMDEVLSKGSSSFHLQTNALFI